MLAAIFAAALGAAAPVTLALSPSAETTGALIELRDVASIVSGPEGIAPYLEGVVIRPAPTRGTSVQIERRTILRRLAEHGIPIVRLKGPERTTVRRVWPRPAPSARPAGPPAAPAGSPVRVLYRGRFVEIAEHGRAMRAARAGQIVPVKLEGGRTIRARIEGPGVAVPVREEKAR